MLNDYTEEEEIKEEIVKHTSNLFTIVKDNINLIHSKGFSGYFNNNLKYFLLESPKISNDYLNLFFSILVEVFDN
jgi:hypothetical protein